MATNTHVKRAIAAYFTRGDIPPAATPTADSYTTELEGKVYVVLVGPDGEVLAVYRRRPHRDELYRLKRWPAEVEPSHQRKREPRRQPARKANR